MDYFITKYDIDCPPDVECAVLEDSIMHKGYPVTGGSKILDGFVSPITAEAVTRLEAAGVHILGKTKLSEFGIGGLGLSGFGGLMGAETGAETGDATSDETGRGKSAELSAELTNGAVAAVASGVATFALCNDYTGAVSREAAVRGVCYIHPTYGTVSRYGLIPAVPSMDQIGVVCKTPADGFRILSLIAGYDPKDGTSIGGGNSEFGIRNLELGGVGAAPGDEGATPGGAGAVSGVQSAELRFGVPTRVASHSGAASGAPTDLPEGLDLQAFVEGLETIDVELEYMGVCAQVMQILCSAEISCNISRYDGVKFGYRAKGGSGLDWLYKKSRTEAFGPDAKMAALLGAMILSQEYYTKFYDKAMRVRRLIKESLAFKKYDVLIVPACYAALSRLCGLPAITVPYQGGGVALIADAQREEALVAALKAVAL